MSVVTSSATSGRRIRLRTVKRIFTHFGPHLRPYRRPLPGAWICMLGITAMELARPWPIKVIFDVILVPRQTTELFKNVSLLVSDTRILLAAVALSILVIAVGKGVFGYGRAFLTASVGQKVMGSLRRQLYRHVQRLSRSFHDANRSGDLFTRLTGDLLSEPAYERAAPRISPSVAEVRARCWQWWQAEMARRAEESRPGARRGQLHPRPLRRLDHDHGGRGRRCLAADPWWAAPSAGVAMKPGNENGIRQGA